MTVPITPPPELVEQWRRTAPHRANETEHYHYITLCAAQWGADQELLACGLLLDDGEHAASYGFHNGDSLHAARRPKPPSEVNQALAALGRAPKAGVPTITVDVEQYETIFLALHRLQELEGLAND